MKLRLTILSVFITIMMSCESDPHSRLKTVMPESDRLSAYQKIELFKSSSEATSAVGQIAMAKLYESEGRYSEAIIAVKAAIQEDPMNSYYHSLRATYAYQVEDISTAYREALTAYQLGSKSLQQSLMLAKMAVTLSEFSIVNEIIDSLALVYPEDPEILFIAARKADNDKNIPLARRNYAAVEKLAPENQDNIYFYAKLLLDENYPDSAYAVLQRGTNNEMSDRFVMLMADVNYAIGSYDSAVYYYSQTMLIKSDTAIYNKIISIYSTTNRVDSVISIAETAITKFPKEREYYLMAAQLLDKKYRYYEALEYYEVLFEMDTLDSLVRSELDYLKRKIAYLQRKKEEQKILADSLSQNQPNTIL